MDGGGGQNREAGDINGSGDEDNIFLSSVRFAYIHTGDDIEVMCILRRKDDNPVRLCGKDQVDSSSTWVGENFEGVFRKVVHQEALNKTNDLPSHLQRYSRTVG